MKNTLKNVVVSIAFAGILAGCSQKRVEEVREVIPKAGRNQSIILHPGCSCGKLGPSYILLTDIDFDGHWDIAEKIQNGLTAGNYAKRVYFKKGYTPAQSTSEDIEFVDRDFFKPYE